MINLEKQNITNRQFVAENRMSSESRINGYLVMSSIYHHMQKLSIILYKLNIYADGILVINSQNLWALLESGFIVQEPKAKPIMRYTEAEKKTSYKGYATKT